MTGEKVIIDDSLYEVLEPIRCLAVGREWKPGQRLGPVDLPLPLLQQYVDEGIVRRMKLKRRSEVEGDK